LRGGHNTGSPVRPSDTRPTAADRTTASLTGSSSLVGRRNADAPDEQRRSGIDVARLPPRRSSGARRPLPLPVSRRRERSSRPAARRAAEQPSTGHTARPPP
jgi:hypothetical protein